MADLEKDKVLDNADMGIWAIEIPADASQPARMSADKTMYRLLGAQETATAEELYAFWLAHIDSGYIAYVQEALQRIRIEKKAEVEYLYHHPDKEMYIRCGGVLDETYTDGLRVDGYYQDISSFMKNNISTSDDYVIADLYRLQKYSSRYIDAYDELHEIDLDTMSARAIFYRKNKYAPVEGSISVKELIQRYVHPDDQQRLMSLFEEENLHKVLNEKKEVQVEVRTLKCDGTYGWGGIICLSGELNSKNHLLFYQRDIEKEKEEDSFAEEKDALLHNFIDDEFNILEVELTNGMVHVIRIKGGAKQTQNVSSLNEVIRTFVEDHVLLEEREEIFQYFSIEHLRAIARSKKESYRDMRIKMKNWPYRWVRVVIMVSEENSNKVFMFMKSIDRERMLQTIMGNYISANCDYIYYIDCRDQYFVRFAENDDTFLPPAEGFDYEQTMLKYIERYVPEKEQQEVKKKMKLDYVLQQLYQNGYYNFTAGVLEKDGEYRRKFLQFQFFDRKRQIILLLRSDITSSYLLNQERWTELEYARREAVTDYLTGIYNRAGCEKEITAYLQLHGKKERSAFLLLDIDNFKAINDSFGHDMGDKVLKDVARILKNNFRSSDIIARLGGDEFVVMMKDIRSREKIFPILKRVIQKLDLHYAGAGGTVNISASMGVALVPEDGDNFQELYVKADTCLYEVKRRSRNGYCLYDEFSGKKQYINRV